MMERLRRWSRELKAQLLTLWFCRDHPDTPLTAKLMAGLVIAYAFSPIDLVPDFIPVLGYLDDLLLVPIGIYVTLRLIPDQVLVEARQSADQWIARREHRPKNHLAAALIVLIWLALAYWAWTAFAP